jgi:hypothetical protein
MITLTIDETALGECHAMRAGCTWSRRRSRPRTTEPPCHGTDPAPPIRTRHPMLTLMTNQNRINRAIAEYEKIHKIPDPANRAASRDSRSPGPVADFGSHIPGGDYRVLNGAVEFTVRVPHSRAEDLAHAIAQVVQRRDRQE